MEGHSLKRSGTLLAPLSLGCGALGVPAAWAVLDNLWVEQLLWRLEVHHDALIPRLVELFGWGLRDSVLLVVIGVLQVLTGATALLKLPDRSLEVIVAWTGLVAMGWGTCSASLSAPLRGMDGGGMQPLLEWLSFGHVGLFFITLGFAPIAVGLGMGCAAGRRGGLFGPVGLLMAPIVWLFGRFVEGVFGFDPPYSLYVSGVFFSNAAISYCTSLLSVYVLVVLVPRVRRALLGAGRR